MSESTATPLTRRAAVAISADALLQQWARQDQAPHGTAVVVGTEIAARVRGGVDWRHPEAVAVAVLARPRNLDVGAREAGWLAAGLAAARALDRVLGTRHGVVWPDSVAAGPESEGGTAAEAAVEVAATAISTLGPGQVEFAILTVRMALPAGMSLSVGKAPSEGTALSMHMAPLSADTARTSLEDAFVAELRAAAGMLEDPAALAAAYSARCIQINEPAEIGLLPHGITRGTPIRVRETGALVIASPTGLEELLAVGSVRFIRLLAQSG